MFEKGTNVIYGSNGVYLVEDVRVEDFLGEKRTYYVLSKPEHKSNDKIFIPCDNENLTFQIKHILTDKEIYALLQTVPREPMKWVNEGRARSEYFKSIFARADRAEVIHMAITIHLRQKEMESQGKKIFLSDENALARAEKVIFEEFSLSIDLPRDNVIPFIMEKMK